MPGRREALTAFYDGPVWRTHRGAANATMVDSDDVLLLRPLHPLGGFPGAPAGQAATPARAGCWSASSTARPAPTTSLASFESASGRSSRARGPPLAWLETEGAVNDFPRLPVRADADVLVCISVLRDERALRRHLALLAADLHWADDVGPALRSRLRAEPEQLVLRPTPRSSLW